jgi:hypothetical protein
VLLRRAIGVLIGTLVVAVLVPGIVVAQEYDLNFTLPTAGKSGCMVCHADPNLVRLQGDRFVSYWIDGGALDESAHAAVSCTGCHVDFAFKAPHTEELVEWQRTAKLACKNCHQDQFDAYSNGVHSLSLKPGEELTEADYEKPLCGDCHGDHGIDILTDNPEGRAALHDRGYDVCGKCHEDAWDSYDDYYQGAAFKRGAPDAPACWDCHGYHDILASSDRRSLVSERSLVHTCKQCHADANEEYVSYAGLVHGTQNEIDANPLYNLISKARQGIGNLLDTIRSWFT